MKHHSLSKGNGKLIKDGKSKQTIVLDGRTNAESAGHPMITQDSDLYDNERGSKAGAGGPAAFDSLTFKSRHSQATSFFISQAQASH